MYCRGTTAGTIIYVYIGVLHPRRSTEKSNLTNFGKYKNVDQHGNV